MNKKTKTKSVTFRISFYLAMLITFLMAVVGFGNLYNTQMVLKKEAIEKGWILVQSGKAVAASYINAGNPGLLCEHLYKMRAMGDVSYIAVIDTAGKIVAHTNQSLVGKNVSFTGGFPSGDAINPYLDGNGKVAGYDLISPIVLSMDGNPIGYFRLGLDTSRQKKLLEELTINMLLISIAAVIAGIMLAKVIANRILKQPIQDLKEATEHIAAGDFAHRVPVRRMDELGTLATAFNSMTGHLANLFMSVRTSAAELTRSSQVILNRTEEFRLAAENARRDTEAAGADLSDKRQVEALQEIALSAKRLYRLVDRLNALSLQFKV